MNNLSKRVQRIKPSATLAISAKAKALIKEGKDIISLTAGEPDFDTPEFIQQAGIQAITEGKTRYTPVSGIPELKQAIVDKLANENDLVYSPEQILVSCGAKHSLYNICQAVLDQEDEAIIPAPYWVSYPDMVKLAGATPVILQASADQNFKITADALKRIITAQTKLLFLNSPSNPTGAVYTKAELRALGDVLLEHPKILIITDDIYEHLLWSEEPFSNILMACPELKERVLVVNGVSKSYAMTGWRIGYTAGNIDIINAMNKIQSQSTSNPCSIAQSAAYAALTGPQDCIATMVNAFKKRHDLMLAGLNAIDGIDCLPAFGTFYLFPNVADLIKTLGLNNDIALCEYLLNKAGLAVVPGFAFGAPNHIRLSFATSEDIIQEGLDRLSQTL